MFFFSVGCTRQAVHKFWRARKAVVANTTSSETHGMDPWDFMALALKASKAGSLNPLEIYCFVMQCKAPPEADAIFNAFLNYDIKFELTDSLTDDGNAYTSTISRPSQRSRMSFLNGSRSY